MAGHPLRSATDRRLGRPLPHQPANQTRVHLVPPQFFTQYHAVSCAYAVLAVVSNCCPPVRGRLPTRYSPVRHSVTISLLRRFVPCCFVRLACVKHAASVHPEPGSNSYIKVLFPASCLAFLRFFRNRQTLVFFRLPPVELTMGCVFLSIVQFSRIRSAFSAAKSILSDVISFVKHFLNFL